MSQSNISTGDASFGDQREAFQGRNFSLPAQIPVPRPAILQQMEALANAVGRHCRLTHAAAAEPAGFLVPEYELLLLGTACWRPLLCEEAQEIREKLQVHVAIVRGDDRDFLGHPTTTIDLLPVGSINWMTRLKPWRRTAGEDLWLAPVEGEGRAVRLSDGLLALSPRAPFTSLFEREYGFEVAQGVAQDRSDKWAGGRLDG